MTEADAADAAVARAAPAQHVDTGWLHRLIGLSDGVFAIAITLIAIEIHPPEHWDHTLAGVWRDTWRSLVGYGISFAVVAGYWVVHRRMFARFVRADGVLTTLNFLVLALIALAPFVCEFITDYGPKPEVMSIYGLMVAAIGTTNAALWGYAAFIGGLVDPALDRRSRLFVLIGLFVASLTVGLLIVAEQTGSPVLIFAMLPVVAVLAFLRRRLHRAV